MKKLLIIPMLFCLLIFASCDNSPKKTVPTSNTDYENIIGIPIKIENLEVAQYDFPESMNWYDAKEVCAKLGKGYRLPTKDELEVMYKNKDRVGGFVNSYYWSSTEYNNVYAWGHYFNNGFQGGHYSKDGEFNKFNVRAVRTF